MLMLSVNGVRNQTWKMRGGRVARQNPACLPALLPEREVKIMGARGSRFGNRSGVPCVSLFLAHYKASECSRSCVRVNKHLPPIH